MQSDAQAIERIIRDNTDAGVTLALEGGNAAGEAQARALARRAALSLERLLARWSEGAESATLEHTRAVLLLGAARAGTAGTQASIMLVTLVTTVLAEALGDGVEEVTSETRAGGMLGEMLVEASAEALGREDHAAKLRSALGQSAARAGFGQAEFAEAATRLGTIVKASAEYVRSHGPSAGQ